MPKYFAITISATNVTVVAATETLILSSDPYSPSINNPRLVIVGHVLLANATGVTVVRTRIRRGTTTSDALVGELSNSPNLAAGTALSRWVNVIDEPGARANIRYSVTIEQVDSIADGTAESAMLQVYEL